MTISIVDAVTYIQAQPPVPVILLADDLLAKARVLDRDQGCLERAVVRLINKTRPSLKKEMKDSINLEQCLELSRRLENSGFTKSRIWLNSSTNDFATPLRSSE